MNKKLKTKIISLALVLITAVVFGLYNYFASPKSPVYEYFDLNNLPEYTDSPFVRLNRNQPYFEDDDYTTKAFEEYGKLDSLGRCTLAYACIGKEIMPISDRGSIGQVKPTGWQTSKYDFVDGKYLYNRCHLIGYQLSGENANEKNLITGTRYMNTEGMLPFENMIAEYVEETGNHVLYRVTPIFENDNLVAKGVVMEAFSVEDEGEGLCFNVFCYNVQPGVYIDYATGENFEEFEKTESANKTSGNYILNTNSKKIHLLTCDSIKDISNKNKDEYTGSIDELLKRGYSICDSCNPQ